MCTVPGHVDATFDNPPLCTSCWRLTWSLFSPAATLSDDWRGRISWKITKHAACYIPNMLQIMIELKWRYAIFHLIQQKPSEKQARVDPPRVSFIYSLIFLICIFVEKWLRTHQLVSWTWALLIPYLLCDSITCCCKPSHKIHFVLPLGKYLCTDV